MSHLQFFLLGPPQVRLHGVPVADFATAKGQALLYYLVVTGRPHPRETLADLLWPDMPEGQARRNLTKALSDLPPEFGPYLLLDRHQVAFNTEQPYWLDVAEFESSIVNRPPAERFSDVSVTALRQAIELYRGDFLSGLTVRNAQPFEEWSLAQREYWRGLLLQALDSLVEVALAGGEAELPSGLEFAQRLLTLDPWRETAHRQMMRLLVRSGQRTAALAHYETCRQVLLAELGVEPDAETTALYESLKAAETPPPHNLEPQPNVFVGRERELRQIAQNLANPACRLLTLVGPGGIGKTRLALHAAQTYVQPDLTQVGPGFPDGVYHVNLSLVEPMGEQTPLSVIADTLATAMGEALDIVYRGPHRLMTQLRTYLQSRQALLILDNFETMIAGAGLLSDLLRAAPTIKLLVTSRERLQLQEEFVIEMEGLELKSAIGLFVERARQVNPGMAETPAEQAAITRICRLIGGAPLAIELAASWARSLSCTQILRELEHNLDFLTTPIRNIPSRHRSLRAVFDYSWDMLSAQERTAFAQFAIFRGGFGLEAAAAVVGASLPTLTALFDKSLLRRLPSGHYDVHDLLRQYAAEKFWGDDHEGDVDTLEAHDTWERYSAYFLNLLRHEGGRLRGAGAKQAVALIRVNLDNIRRAWRWALNELQFDAIQNTIAVLTRYYDLIGQFQEGVGLSTAAIERLLILKPLLTDLPQQHAAETLHIRLLLSAARLLLRQGLMAQARANAEEALTLAQGLGSYLLEAQARQQVGEVLVHMGESSAGREQLEFALRLAQANYMLDTEAEALRDLAIAHYYSGSYPTALVSFELAQSKFQSVGDLRNEALSIMNLGVLAYQRDEYPQARAYFEQALDDFRRMGDRWGETLCLSNLTATAYEQRQYTEAQVLARQGLFIARYIRESNAEANILHSLGEVYRALGLYDQAEDSLQQAAHLFQQAGYRWSVGLTLADLGLLRHQRGDDRDAILMLDRALDIGRELGARSIEAQAMTYLGHAWLALGDTSNAIEVYQRALTMRHDLGETISAWEAQAGLVRAYLALGDTDQAYRLATELLPLLEGDLPGIEEPFRFRLSVYRALRAAADPATTPVLAQTIALLHAQADSIPDLALRHTYLHNVAAHREILQFIDL